MPQIKVLVFGSFDPLHPGHEYFFKKAKQIGSHLTVVVARDQTIREVKKRRPHQDEAQRLTAVKNNPHVDEALLGDSNPQSYSLLKRLSFDVLALGYDQKPDDVAVKEILRSTGHKDATAVRLDAFKPEKYKSTFYRS